MACPSVAFRCSSASRWPRRLSRMRLWPPAAASPADSVRTVVRSFVRRCSAIGLTPRGPHARIASMRVSLSVGVRRLAPRLPRGRSSPGCPSPGRARGVALPRCRTRGRGRGGRFAAGLGAHVPGAHHEEGRLRGGRTLSRAAGRRGGAGPRARPPTAGRARAAPRHRPRRPLAGVRRATCRTACPTASTRSASCPTAAAGRIRSSSFASGTRPARAGPSRARRSRGSTAGTTRCPTAGSATSSRSGCSATGRWT